MSSSEIFAVITRVQIRIKAPQRSTYYLAERTIPKMNFNAMFCTKLVRTIQAMRWGRREEYVVYFSRVHVLQDDARDKFVKRCHFIYFISVLKFNDDALLKHTVFVYYV